MSNLENLTQKILNDAENEAKAIIEEAKIKNEGIVSSRVKEANERAKRIIERATEEAKMAKERVISNSELQVRDEKLKSKQLIMDRVFLLAKEKLNNLNEEDYIKFLQSSFKNLNLKGTETVIVTEKMRDRVKSLGLFTNISDTETVNSGFIIKDGKILINYTFDSLVDFIREEIESDIARGIFKE